MKPVGFMKGYVVQLPARREQPRERDAGTAAPAGSPFLAGCEAFRAGIVVGDNPHDDTTDAHWRWMAGWVAAGESALKTEMEWRARNKHP